jgi:hypothetical protein
VDIDIFYSLNKISINGDINFSLEFKIGIEYNDFLCFYIPTLDIKYRGSLFQIDYTSNAFSENLEFKDYPDEAYYNFTYNNLPQSSIGSSSTSDTSLYNENIAEGFTFFGIGMALAGGFVATLSSVLAFFKVGGWSKIMTIATFALYVITIITAATIIAKNKNKDTVAARFYGMGFGFLLAGLVFTKIANYLEQPRKYLSEPVKKLTKGTNYLKIRKIWTTFVILDVLFSVAGITFDFLDLSKVKWADNIPWKIFTSIFTVSAGILSLAIGAITLIYFTGHKKDKIDGKFRGNNIGLQQDDKALIATVFGVGSLVLGAIFVSMAKILQLQDE